MPPALRPYQRKLKADTYAFWNSRTDPSNVMAVAATGSGKTVLFSDILAEYQGVRGALVHRQELVGQISLTLGKYGVRHRVIGAEKTVRDIISQHITELGTNYVDQNAKCFAASVDTLNGEPDAPWMQQTGLIVTDESHHVLKTNKWGKAMARFSRAYGFMPTATPGRPDGLGLGRHADGLADVLLAAPEMRDIINMGYLTDYRLILAESDVKLGEEDITASGDFSPAKASAAHAASKRIVGDVVNTYLQYAKGKLGIIFATDVEESGKIAAAFRAAGVKAEAVSAKTPAHLRAEIIRRYRRREIHILVNCDLFGEGFDLPAIEYVAFARHTASFIVFAQQFGRALRLLIEKYLADQWDSFTDAERRAHIAASTKPRAIIADHVGNIMRFMGPPDAAWRRGKWTLDRREKRAMRQDEDAIPLTACLNPEALMPKSGDPAHLAALYAKGWTNEQIVAGGHAISLGVPCAQPYERARAHCPYCGYRPVPTSRSTPEQVDGNMMMLDDAAVAALWGAVSANLEAPIPTWPGQDPAIAGALRKRRSEHQSAIYALKNAAAWWSGYCTHHGYSDAEAHKKFYLRFGIDAWTMQTLDRKPAEELHARICSELAKFGIDATVNAGVALPNII